nr:protein suppressor of white apricot isoform X4 [Ipomoea trifida]
MDFRNEVVGSHALFFDDDAMAAFVNSADALVEWNSLKVDRYEVRQLLSAPPLQPRRSITSLSHAIDSSLKSELDLERYLDLPPSSDEPGYLKLEFELQVDHRWEGKKKERVQEGSAVGFENSGFCPSFSVPENLLQCLRAKEAEIHMQEVVQKMEEEFRFTRASERFLVSSRRRFLLLDGGSWLWRKWMAACSLAEGDGGDDDSEKTSGGLISPSPFSDASSSSFPSLRWRKQFLDVSPPLFSTDLAVLCGGVGGSVKACRIIIFSRFSCSASSTKTTTVAELFGGQDLSVALPRPASNPGDLLSFRREQR